MTEIKQRYSAFGPAVMEQIRLEINRSGDLRELLTRLDVSAPDDLEQQHIALYNLIARYGPLFFMTVAKSDWTAEQVQKMKANLKMGVDTPAPGSGSRLTSKSVSPLEGKPLAPKPSTDIPPMPPPSVPRAIEPKFLPTQKVVQMRSPYSAPAKGSTSSDPSGTASRSASTVGVRPPAAPVAYVDTPNYKGPDRRLRGERRLGPRDRRATLDTVFKNNRFGGKDRRKEVRREADREKMRREGTGQ